MVNELGFKIRKTTVQSVWMMWEKAFALLSHFRGSHKSRFGICTVMLKKHRGQPIVCQDATVINQGEWVGELHLDNERILKLIRSEGSDRATLPNGSHAAQINAANQRSLRIAVRVQAGQGFIGDYTAPSGINARSWL